VPSWKELDTLTSEVTPLNNNIHSTSTENANGNNLHDHYLPAGSSLRSFVFFEDVFTYTSVSFLPSMQNRQAGSLGQNQG
jgi:hypothetical protein